MAKKKDKEPLLKDDDFDLLFVDDIGYKTKSNKMHTSRKPYKPINPAELKSFMPGKIPEVFVQVGDQVKEGDALLILEAMKMKNVILAPFDGTVKAVNVKPDVMVPKNFVLVELQ